MTMMSRFVDMTSSSMFVWRCFVSLVRFNYWSKFYANIITGSGVMQFIFIRDGVTRNPEMGNTPVWILPNIWETGTSKGYQIWHKCLLQLLPFVKTNRLGGRGGLKLPPLRLGLRISSINVTKSADFCEFDHIYWRDP